MCEITFVNHSSVIISSGDIRLLCDPWIEGTAFNNGWNLIAPSRFGPEDYRHITHIWFSHEHPDHFHPPSLKQVPQDVRPHIEVLYQATRDRKVIDYCAKQGFRTRELKPYARTELGADFHVTCGPVPFYDSWLLIETAGKRLLNLNDCEINNRPQAAKVRRQIGAGPIEVLLTQFSYARHIGEPEHRESRVQAARAILDRVIAQTLEIRPQYVIPFASFIYFCHPENLWLNDSVNPPALAAERITRETSAIPIVMYPRDVWQVGTAHDNASALTRWEADYAAIPRFQAPSRNLTLADLERHAQTFLDRVWRKNNSLALALARRAHFFRPVTIHLWDLNQTVTVDLRHGIRPASSTAQPPDASMAADSLGYVLEFEWGFDTLIVNGRFRATPEGFSRMMRLFGLSVLNNTGRSFGPGLLLDREFSMKAVQVLRRLFTGRGMTVDGASTN